MDNPSQSLTAEAPEAAAAPGSVADAGPRYFNRGLEPGWRSIGGCSRKPATAHPLLERLRFLSISASNLDEFFMVRVAGLKAHQALGVEEFRRRADRRASSSRRSMPRPTGW